LRRARLLTAKPPQKTGTLGRKSAINMRLRAIMTHSIDFLDGLMQTKVGLPLARAAAAGLAGGSCGTGLPTRGSIRSRNPVSAEASPANRLLPGERRLPHQP
jgi:hypothetical protein